MLAGLPMYDWPEISTAMDEFWTLLRGCLLRRGIDAPETLTRQDDLVAMWHSPDLVFGQTCALPFAMDFNRHVRLIGSPAYDIGCAPGFYYSLLIVPKGCSTRLERFRGSVVINEFSSQSGFATLMLSLVAAGAQMEDVDIRASGGHRASIRAVANGEAELAAIDVVSFTLAQRYMPEADAVEVIGCTRPTPGMALISALPDAATDGLAGAFEEAVVQLSPSLRRELLLTGFLRRRAEDYAGVARDWRSIEARLPTRVGYSLKSFAVPR
ncbi:PhnD/SsuA/transferrin family substrate-binding protein [Rhizobium wenxiniae]|uniref:phosphate/phosphite/phosphonate ABC transporter substrate-binding protein n=1 Tax=Rhizobium wenxiniae TaxID=1737357 RepID=UPI001C6EBB42|nr:PhnD/SsuA/transferrin family substrate-binding protein [Rhizobium wenxiniae]MBW9087127.1 PhnD/SsuA/transferrin family substrate-binding protein [Rhizobium wenxiniae]